MVVWSSILRATGQKFLQNGGFRTALVKNESARCMSEQRVMVIKPSRFQWHKTKDWFHFYFLLGLIPLGIGIFMVNVFIGPATLEEIPEDYVPKEWEYHRHPIKRFLARYFFPSPQQEYEKFLHYAYQENQIRQIRLLENRVNDVMGTRRDYRGPYFQEYYGSKYLYRYKEIMDELEERD
ncbi:NADH dehydrogenase [ubiquinone] 1 beta subcomplex subunit 5, mitochondrial [Harpegnathos saltator]|uniref:NADH dehydrogenase [ubiquinone] 1 beta subcomplex subunit 5, mitochondrial n=1 Tax=Harpegnathos saltator TaxID=610380 RepID=E2BQ53_HARSA|nr:NADH dehydrogenase [ubiquinone] 1 beta subcomplex subunit 5, mitochondrial [Harpegnathos saltator]EFN82172.1 NADH dehydrogenase [ubiquinone] 1 beta subcomplex subunit 5, mitochondrial [Harpegnathos saltator]